MGDVARIAAGVGVTPEALVVAGVYDAAAATLEAFASEAATCEAIVAKEQALDALAESASAIAAALDADAGNEVLRADDAAVAEYEAALLELRGLKDGLFETATATLPPAARARLAAVRAASPRRVPAEFRILSRSDDGWKLVERALRAEARCGRRGEALRTDFQALLATIRSDTGVIQAATDLTTQLAGVEAVFAEAAEPE
jgi:hypothetical protein